MFLFNPSKLLLGLLQADKVVISSKEMAALLFVHEASRVFHDLLTQQTDRGLFYQLLSKELEDYFQVNICFKNDFKWSWAKVLRRIYNINERNFTNNSIFHLKTSQ